MEHLFSILNSQFFALFSVIIPALNEEKLLARCLQQFTPEIKEKFAMEIIVSDGGSNDKTLEIASQYTDKISFAGGGSSIAGSQKMNLTIDPPRRNTSTTRHRQTIAEGRNCGARIARGDIFVFLNADTIIPNIEKFFDSVVSELRDPKTIALAVKVEVLPEERKVSDTIFHGFFNRYVHLLNVLGIAMGRGECQIVRRDAFHSAGGYNEALAAGEDFEFYKRLAKIGKIKYDPNLLVYESPRRYRKYGYPKVYAQWIANALSVLFRKKAANDTWEQVR